MGIEKISGIILAGGKSSRFGVNKAVQKTSSGKLLIEFVIEALSQFCNEIIVAGSGSPFLDSLDKVRIVNDEPGLKGPIAGMVSALRLAENNICAVVGCDMPFASPSLFRGLITTLEESAALICVPRWDDFLEPLHAVYSRKTLPMLMDFVEREGRSLTEFIKWCHDNAEISVRRNVVFYRYELKKHGDDNCDPFFNINTTGEFEFFENYCQKGL
ncbi:MAG: molybdenum cofactor guanylyltransferase [Actinobacteria bacterium]|nr:molybdenum cofactor guanylyltransferase [Actinomycetota bacterium]